MNQKIHAYNLETVIVGYNGATIFVIALKYVRSSMPEPDDYNLQTVIVRCNGATIFVIALFF